MSESIVSGAENLTHCDQCMKECPVDSLSCNHGRARFGLEPEENDNEKRDRAQEKWRALRAKKQAAKKARKEEGQ